MGKVKRKRGSMRKAINEKCKECVHDPLDKGTWKQQVENCNALECPLYDFRPKSAAEPKG